MCSTLSFGFEGGIWDLIVLIPDHCLSVNSVRVFFSLLVLRRNVDFACIGS